MKFLISLIGFILMLWEGVFSQQYGNQIDKELLCSTNWVLSKIESNISDGSYRNNQHINIDSTLASLEQIFLFNCDDNSFQEIVDDKKNKKILFRGNWNLFSENKLALFYTDSTKIDFIVSKKKFVITELSKNRLTIIEKRLESSISRTFVKYEQSK